MKLKEIKTDKGKAYQCSCCGQVYDELPLTFGNDFPDYYFSIPPDEREARVEKQETPATASLAQRNLWLFSLQVFNLHKQQSFLFFKMSRNYKIRDQEKLYFISFATVNWIDVFTRQEYKDIVPPLLVFFTNKRTHIANRTHVPREGRLVVQIS